MQPDPDRGAHRRVEHTSDVLAAAYGDSPAVGDDRVALSFAEVDARAAAFAAQLAEHGFGAGDVLAVKLPNRAELLVAMFAAWRLGGAMTPINPAFTENEVAHQVADSGARLIVTTDADAPTGGAAAIPVDTMRAEADEPGEPEAWPRTTSRW